MFPKTIYVQILDDESLSSEKSESDMLDCSDDGQAYAVYELKYTGTIVESKRAVPDVPRRGRPRKNA